MTVDRRPESSNLSLNLRLHTDRWCDIVPVVGIDRYRGELDGLVLGVLQSGPAHGYEIAKRVRMLSEGIMSAGEAKLYACLHRLEGDGLVTAEWIPQEGKPARKVYTLTPKGGGALKAKRAAWRDFAKAVETMLSPRAAEEENRG